MGPTFHVDRSLLELFLWNKPSKPFFYFATFVTFQMEIPNVTDISIFFMTFQNSVQMSNVIMTVVVFC